MARLRRDRFLVTGAVAITMLLTVVGCSGSNAPSSADNQIANEVLSNFWPKSTQWGFSESIDKQILGATGQTAYEGSYTWPGSWTVANAPLGAHIVTFTIKAKPRGLLWTHGTITLQYWVSQDGQYIKPENPEARELWYIYLNP